MVQSMPIDMILAFGMIGASLLAMGGTVAALRGLRSPSARLDTREAVRKAPYGRLHNVLPVDGA